MAAIEKAGAVVYYDWEWTPRGVIRGGRPWAPKWLVDRTGVDYFGHVNYVTFFDSSTPTDATIEQVGRLSQLEELFLVKSLDDTGVAHLEGLSKLSRLDLFGTKVTDAGLVASEGAEKSVQPQPRPHADHRRWAGASRRG